MNPPIALPAITLPQRCQDGIGAVAAKSLQVSIAIPTALQPVDLLELFINDRFARAAFINPLLPGQQLLLEVPQAVHRSGMLRLHYTVLRAGTGSVQSPVTLVRAKLEYPGGAPRSPGETENPRLPPIRLPRHPNLGEACRRGGLPFQVQPYRNMATGDRITLRWGDARLDLPALLPGQVGRPVRGWAPMALLEQVRPGNWPDISWCVRDRVGNHSRWAPPQALGLVPERV